MARFFVTLVAAAAALSQVSAAPFKRDSTIGEPAFSASNGVIKSETPAADYAETSTPSEKMMDATSTSSSSMMEETSTSTMMMEDSMTSTTSTMMADETSTSTTAYYAAATTEAQSSYNMPMYGSGSKSWGGMGYNDCVQQCIAEFGQPSATYTAQAVEETATATSNEGTGTTHTIIVAPTQGVLRYVPFAVNASVGDTVKYIWGAGPHTVTKSAALTPCNASMDADFFTSGKQNKSFVFTESVNDTNPLFFYCTVPGHCQKGMFGIINPPNGDVDASVAASGPGGSSSSSMTVMSYMMSMAQNDSSMAALWGYVSNKTSGTSAENWGMGMQLSGMPMESWGSVAQNVMYTQLFYAANPGMLEKGVGASDVTGNGIVIPSDITQTLATLSTSSSTTSNAGAVPANAADVTASGTASALAQSASATMPAYGNGSGRLASSTVLVGAMAVVASFVML